MLNVLGVYVEAAFDTDILFEDHKSYFLNDIQTWESSWLFNGLQLEVKLIYLKSESKFVLDYKTSNEFNINLDDLYSVIDGWLYSQLFLNDIENKEINYIV